MSSTVQKQDEPTLHTSNVQDLITPLEGASLTDAHTSLDSNDAEKNANTRPVPFRIYTRSQLLNLYNSPLVQPPSGMPELKAWFGTENEQNLSKKDLDPPTSAGARDRRFRREPEDGDISSRPSYRSTLSQPSQMGNFKHHSLRVGDRDKDVDKDRERDLRDKEGQERLRHLSDKYDRDRLNLPSSARGKERDAVPHLGSIASSRTASQSQVSNGTSRRGETRDSSKRKVGESGEDWRRGAEPTRTVREERSETGRKDRDDRERARSRPRDSSRPRQEPSTSKRERVSERDDLREKSSRGDRDREADKDVEDDPRRWRDDGKRDERMAARRARDKGANDNSWEGSNDRRWTTTEERDGRYKRTNGRDKRSGTSQDDTKERDDRRDREKEKEPAWMDTYIPTDLSPGILGGKSADGELDGIQAWKKTLKDKDKKEKPPSSDTKSNGMSLDDTVSPPIETESQLDEIQLFRLMMQKEKEKRQISIHEPVLASLPAAHKQGENGNGDVPHNPEKIQATQPTSHAYLVPDSQGDRTLVSEETSKTSQSYPLSIAPTQAPSFISGEELDRSKFPSSNTAQSEPIITAERQTSELNSQFNPPPGSRLLAFARAPAKPANLLPPETDMLSALGPVAARSMAGFSPFEDISRKPRAVEESRNLPNPPNTIDSFHRPQADRLPFSSQIPSGLLETPSTDANSNGYAAAKGSRFAKFFDGKVRDSPLPHVKAQTPVGFTSSPPGLNHRQEQGGFTGSHGNVEDRRTMDDIFAMLNNSSHGHNQTPNNHLGSLSSIGSHSHPFNGQNNLHLLQHQHQVQMQSVGRTESLYDSRLEDRSFVPDGLVPGLRTAPPPRSRDTFADAAEESLHFNMQRLAQQQQHQRGDSLYPSLSFNQQGRGVNVPLHQPQYRGGPSPNTSQHSPLLNAQQRLPPGLANLGARPPHEPSQFLGPPTMTSGGLHTNNIQNSSPFQQPFNNFVGNNVGFGGPQIRGPLPTINMQNSGPHLPTANLGQNNIDLRMTNSSFPPGIGSGGINASRTMNNNHFIPHQRGVAQVQPHLGIRLQQPHLPPHILPHLLPTNVQPQQGLPGPANQPAHDLMALLMGGPHRE